MIKTIEKISNKKIINEDQNDMCLICWTLNCNIILCSKCKYVYCKECATKINNSCCICVRPNKISYNYFYYDLENDYVLFDDDHESDNHNFFKITINLILYTVVFLGMFIFFLIFIYTVIMFFYNILFNNIQTINVFEDF